jgi:DNA-binding NarL/FixJ family response regulator
LVRAVRAASRGEMVVSGVAVERLHSHLNGVDGAHGLTDRERQVLSLLERGSTDREIAAALTISVKTVEKHVGSILRKLGAQNRTQAVARARERLAG